MFYNNNFRFYHSVLAGKHYYDNRGGAPIHYLSYLISGECRIVSENDTVHIKAGNVFYIPKGYRYQSFWRGERIDFLSFGFRDTGTREEFRSQLQILPADGALIEDILKIPFERGGVVTCRTLSVFYDVLDRLMPYLSQGDGREKRLIKQAKIYISQNPRCTVPQIAEACGISEPYLYAVCRRAGTTPNTVKQQVLCEMAADLLTSTDLRVEEIAERLGFSSDTYFRKVFKKHIGQAPLTIRKNAVM